MVHIASSAASATGGAKHRSLWMATAASRTFGMLETDLRADVAVVGSGIVGLTTAVLLQREGLDVVVLEASELAAGATAHSTVKVTIGHGLHLSDLAHRYGHDTAAAYLRANRIGMTTIGELQRTLNIDCDLVERRHILYAEDDASQDAVLRELAVEEGLGLPATFSREIDVPFPVTGALILDGQAQFHPRRYLLGLADRFVGIGGSVYDHTPVENIDDAGELILRTSRGEVRADHVVVATGMPIVANGLFFTKVFPRREYAVAAVIDRANAPLDMYYSAGEPTHSLRTAEAGGEMLLIVVGGSHTTGEEEDTEQRYEALSVWLRERFPVTGLRYRWSTQDYDSMDGIPFVGYAGRSNLLVATGFGGWGMTNGSAAAAALRDTILGRDTSWADIYDVDRHHPLGAATSFVTENLRVGVHRIGDRLLPHRARLDALVAGDGIVVDAAGGPVAVHRDDAGALHAVSAICSHLGCVVGWNAAERSWDCPCHGSRFGVDGRVLHAPATRALEHRDLPDPGV
jgi:glycine/D-amino acid oxidase-like deaminating enzyme/nitrite reductase/ring-hydroxylating ferredoxin subunit